MTNSCEVSALFEIDAGCVSLRHLRVDDIPAMQDLNEDPLVMQHITGPQGRSDTANWIKELIAGYANRPGIGWFAVNEKVGGELVGMAALKQISGACHAAMKEPICCRAKDEEIIEIGWRFFPEYWGRGFATATGRALVDYGFRKHGLPRIVALAFVENERSCQAIQNCGLQVCGEFEILNRTAHFFAIERAAWQSGSMEQG